ncbi:MAG: AAA family ATPase [Halobacteria archaeon]
MYADNLYSTLQFLCRGHSQSRLEPREHARENLEFLEEDIKACSPDQAIALTRALLGNEDVLTVCGKAGVGKTYFIKLFNKILASCFMANVVICASTGIASHNCGGAGTLHSVFSVGLGNKLPWDFQEEREGWKRSNALSIAYRLSPYSPLAKIDQKLPTYIIIDEVSMLSSELLNVCYQIANYLHGGEHSLKAAAQSLKFIVCGDSMQLLPIPPSKKSREYSSLPWEKARWDLGDAGEHEEPSLLRGGFADWFESVNLALLTNHRQQDERDFANALNYIRLGGKITEGPAKLLKKRLIGRNGLEEPQGLDVIHVYFSNKEASAKNREMIESLDPKKRKTHYAQVSYVGPKKDRNVAGVVVKETVQVKQSKYGKEWKESAIIVETNQGQETIPKKWLPDWASPVQELGIGLPFMVRQNFPERDIYNGTVGTIVEFFDDDSILIRLDDGREEVIEPIACRGITEQTNDGKDVGVYKGLPGHPASSLTGSKVQGLTVTKPYVVHFNRKMRGLIPPHWTYVVLSRPVKPELLYIDGDIATINQTIKINRSALAFTQQAELNMQDECRGELFADGVTPEDVANQRPVLLEANSEQFSFRVYVEDEEFDFTAEPAEGGIKYTDLEEGEVYWNDDWYYHPQVKAVIERYMESYNHDSFVDQAAA